MRERVARQLPSYMVPLHFLEIPAMPRLASQKVDRNTLRMQTKGLATRAHAQDALLRGEFQDPVMSYLDSLGFARAVTLKQLELLKLWDTLTVLGMANVILFHWYWYVLVEPRTYEFPSPGRPEDSFLPMPKLPMPGWALFLYRLATQDWAYGVFCFAAAAHTSSEQSAFTQRDVAILALYFYAGGRGAFAGSGQIRFRASRVELWHFERRRQMSRGGSMERDRH